MENLTAATGELRDRQDKLSRATAALIVAVKEAGVGPWEAGSGRREEALLRWLGDRAAWMKDLKESLDQKKRELAMWTQVGEKKESAKDFLRYRAKEEWILEERRRLRQQARKDRDKQDPEQGQREGGIRISSPSGAPLRASPCVPKELHAPAKLPEIVYSLPPSRVTVVDLGPIGVGTGKSSSRHEQESPREEYRRSKLPAPHHHEEVPVQASLRYAANDRCKVSSDRPETQERREEALLRWLGDQVAQMTPGSTNRMEYQKLSIDEPNTDSNLEAHAPTSPIFTTGAEQLARSLPQPLSRNTREGQGTLQRGRQRPAQERAARLDRHPHREGHQRESSALYTGERASNSRRPTPPQPNLARETPQFSSSHLNTSKARGKAINGGTELRGAAPGSALGRNLARQCAADGARHRGQRASEGFDTGAKPEAPSESHVHSPYRPRDTQRQSQQEASTRPAPRGTRPHPRLGAGASRCGSVQEQ